MTINILFFTTRFRVKFKSFLISKVKAMLVQWQSDTAENNFRLEGSDQAFFNFSEALFREAVVPTEFGISFLQ